MLPKGVEKVLEPLNFKGRALLLLDSLHGDGPTLDLVEKLELHYIVGANKLAIPRHLLETQPEVVWQSTGPRPELGWEESAVCVCWIQCSDWNKKRLLVGRRWKRNGEFLYHVCGVMTDLKKDDLSHMTRRGMSFGEAIWRLYDLKQGHENYYTDLLDDINLHHPPCREHVRNAGFYTVAALAHCLGRAVDLLGGRDLDRGCEKRQDGGKRKRRTPKRMRLWRLRRRLFSIPARIAYHARRITITILGVSDNIRKEFESFWSAICRC